MIVILLLVEVTNTTHERRNRTMTTNNKNSEAYHTGYEARVQGDSAVCPYPACDYRHHDWMAGYADAA
jgi:ribosome modulation factor